MNAQPETRRTPITVSVVIPTLGRGSLQRTLHSVCEQTYPAYEIVVANDSATQQPVFTESSFAGIPVVEVFTGGQTGAGNSRNEAVKAATGTHIAYLDDDDTWLPHHLEQAVRSLTERPELDVYTSRTVLVRTEGTRVAPKVCYSGRGSVVDFFYGPWSWLGRERAISTITWVFRRELAVEFPMQDLPDKEDVWWLLQVDAAGYRVWQSPAAGAIYFEEPQRTRSRERLDIELSWAQRLEELQPAAGANFLINTAGRRLARAGDRAGWQRLMSATSHTFALTPGQRAVRGLERALLTLRGRDAESVDPLNSQRRPTER